jgi:hypothetical protein
MRHALLSRQKGSGGCTVGSGPIYVRRYNIVERRGLTGTVTVKVAPSIATSFFTYELVKEFLLG